MADPIVIPAGAGEVIGDAPDPKTSGTPPKTTCEKADGFDNLDGEGVAYSEPHFYVVGSHGCSRKKGRKQRLRPCCGM